MPEVAAGALQIRRDDVPGDPALRQMVEGRYHPRKGERMVLQHRARERESQVLRRVCHRGNQEHGVVDRNLRGLRHRRLPVPPIDIVHTHYVRQEERVELASFQKLGQFYPGAEIRVLVHLVIRTHPEPWRLVHHAVHMKRIEVDSLVHRAASLAGELVSRKTGLLLFCWVLWLWACSSLHRCDQELAGFGVELAFDRQNFARRLGLLDRPDEGAWAIKAAMP